MPNMNRQEMIDRILKYEWEMFHNVNGDTRAVCQQDRMTFESMRRAQYEAWSDETVAAFLEDIEAADAEGRNLSREKYIHMMKATDPEGYEAFRKELPAADPVREELVDKLWEKYRVQTERLREKYPILALGGRHRVPLFPRDLPRFGDALDARSLVGLRALPVLALRRKRGERADLGGDSDDDHEFLHCCIPLFVLLLVFVLPSFLKTRTLLQIATRKELRQP